MNITTCSIGEKALLACALEATARKPGNVHPWAPTEEMSYADFLLSAHLIAEPMNRAGELGVGETVLSCVRRTQQVVGTNTNLGIVLLFAPLACAAAKGDLPTSLQEVLRCTTVEDSRAVYEAIRLARPGGLGEVDEQDVRGEPTLPLGELMRLAQERDLIAAQYANGFRHVQMAASWLGELAASSNVDWETALLTLYLRILSSWPDTLIRRKHGSELARCVQEKAARLCARHAVVGYEQTLELDRELRLHRPPLNPGTSADFTASALFYLLLSDAPLVAELLQRHGKGPTPSHNHMW